MKELPYANKSLGQHWLTDFMSLSAMCDAVDVKDGDTVLEVGPGLGTLTELLCERADRVIAVEFDQKLAKELPGRVPESNLEVVQQDILSFDLTALPADYKLVANIPYYLTSNLIRTLSESSNPPSSAAILIQKEVAERVAAKPGDMSLLSVTAQYYWEASLGIVMPAHLFTPPPKVNSQILILNRRTEPLFPDIDVKQFFRLVKAGFSNRRKTLLNSLSAGLQIGKPETQEILTTAGVKSSARPQELSLDEWYSLYKTVAARNT